MYATKEEFAKAKVHSVIMVQGNPAAGFSTVGSAHRLWGTDPKRVEVYELPNDNDPPAVQVKRFAGTKQEYTEDAPDPERIGMRSLREMKQPGSRLSIWGDGESVGAATAAEVASAKGEVSRLAGEITELKAANAKLTEDNVQLSEELESVRAELAALQNAGAGSPPAGGEQPKQDDGKAGKGKDGKGK